MCTKEKKKKKERKHWACLLHMRFYTCVSDGHSSTHPCAHTGVRGPAGSSELMRCVWVKCHVMALIRPDAFAVVPLLPVFPTVTKLSLDGEQMPLQWGGQINSISRWGWLIFLADLFERLHHPIWQSLALPTTLPPLFLAMEPDSVTGFCSMWEVFKDLMRPVRLSPWLI